MKNSLEILEATRRKKGNCTWYRLAVYLAVNPSSLINIKNGRSPLSKHLAVKCAKILGVEPADLVIITESERAHDPDLKASYKRLMARAGVAVAAVGQGLVCILCKITRARRIVPGAGLTPRLHHSFAGAPGLHWPDGPEGHTHRTPGD